MKAYGEVDVKVHIFLTSAPVGGEWSASRPCRFTLGERAPSTHWIGGWVDLRAGLDYVEKRKFLTLSGLELRLLGRPARSQSLYRLHYPRLIITENSNIVQQSNARVKLPNHFHTTPFAIHVFFIFIINRNCRLSKAKLCQYNVHSVKCG
jgi:hypothetical protein